MHFRPYFSSWAREVDRFLASYLEKRAREARKLAPIAGDLVSDFAGFLVGGKRLRAGLVKLGYEISGGKNSSHILPISAAVEVLHGAFLVHDDIIDADLLRHGRPTIYAHYKARQEKRKKNNPLHYGESMGIIAGDIELYEPIRLILSSDFSSTVKVKILKELVGVVITTGFGEALDVELPFMSHFTQKDVLTIHRLKTSYYTFAGPLTFGALAAGAGKREINAIQNYAFPIGIAFQLQDDILGMFGDEETFGKPVDSDIKEGKNTLLYVEVLKRGTIKQKQFLKKVWGNKSITSKEVAQARDLIKETGALEYSVKMARELVEKGKRAILRITKDPEYQEIFSTLADYIIKREK